MIYDARRLRQIFFDLRTEASGPGRNAAALGVGTFIGCSPFYGFHLVLVWFVGWLLHLNRLKMYVAANISNPLLSPVLILTEIQTGAWARQHEVHELSLAAIRETNAWVYGLDLLIGSVIVGTILGLVVAAITLATTSTARGDSFAALWERASEPYLPLSIVAWEFARGKLPADPIYRVTTGTGLLRGGKTLIDVGCGQGLTMAVLVHAKTLWAEGRWPADAAPPPLFERIVGIEMRPRIARLATRALGSAVEVRSGNALNLMPEGAADAIIFFDVLHMMGPADQERLLARAADALSPTGTILIREADPAGGWRFATVRAGNRLKAILVGRWRQQFHFRPVSAWASLLTQRGLQVSVQSVSTGTFANVLLRGVRSVDGPALHELPDVNNRGEGNTRRGIEFTTDPERARAG